MNYRHFCKDFSNLRRRAKAGLLGLMIVARIGLKIFRSTNAQEKLRGNILIFAEIAAVARIRAEAIKQYSEKSLTMFASLP